MAKLGNVTGAQFTSENPATLPNHLVRLDQMQAAISSGVDAGHTHTSSQITDFAEATADQVAALIQDSHTVRWNYDDPGGELSAAVALKPGGGLTSDSDGLSTSGVASENHTHSGLHDPVTLGTSTSIEFTLAGPGGQVLAGEVKLSGDSGLIIEGDGLQVDFGSGVNQVARGNHGHVGLHNKVTVQASTTLTPTIVDGDQKISGDVKMDPNPPGARILNTSAGIYTKIGTSGAAAYEHTHPVATTSTDGLLSAADKVKLDQYVSLVQLNQPVLYTRHDFVALGDYIGGRKRWEQRMLVTKTNLTANPGILPQRLALQVNGVLTGDTIDIPAGAHGVEVQNAVTFGSTFIEVGEYARWICTSGVPAGSGVENFASFVYLEMNVQPALSSIPTVKLNCGGSAAAPFAADAYYDVGGTGAVPNAIDVSGVVSPAPQAVYQSHRGKFYDNYPLTYTIPGLARALDYTVRLHFAEILWNNTGDQRFNIEVIGQTTQSVSNYDVIAAAGGKFKANIQSFVLRADSNGIIKVRLTPLLGAGSGYHVAINGIEIIP